MIKQLLNYLKRGKENKFKDFLNQLKQIYKYAPIDFGGGCSYEKALTLAFLIKEYNLMHSADIGVYRGRSLFPQSLSHKLNTNGIAFAIDPYDSIAAIQVDRLDIKNELTKFAKTTDFNQIYNDVLSLINNFNLEPNTKFIRQKSHEASEFFVKNNIKLGLVHIDGNHDTKYVMQDVYDYLPLLDDTGFIVLDDITWESVRPAYDYLSEHLTYLGECVNASNDFAIYTNINKSKVKQISDSKVLVEEIINFNKN
jgi:hypothetical protein